MFGHCDGDFCSKTLTEQKIQKETENKQNNNKTTKQTLLFDIFQMSIYSITDFSKAAYLTAVTRVKCLTTFIPL